MNNAKNIRLVVFACFLGYMVSYIGRYAFSTNLENLIDSCGVSMESAGYVSSAFFFCYGFGQFANGMLCGKFNSKNLISFSLIVSSLLTLSVYFTNNILLMSILWGVNGIFLSTLWCNMLEILSKFRGDNSIGKMLITLGISTPAGIIVAYGLSSLLTYLGIWKLYFIFSGVFELVGAVVFYLIVSKHGNENAIEQIEDDNKNVSLENIEDGKQTFIRFFGLAIIPFFALAALNAIVQEAIQSWAPSYFTNIYNLPTYFSILITLVLSLFVVLSTFIATRCFKVIKNIFLTIAFFSLINGILLVLTLLFKLNILFMIVIFASVLLLSHSVNSTVSSIVPLVYRKQIKTGRIAGIANSFTYIGHALSGFLLGKIAEEYGWNVFMWVLFGVCAISVPLCVWGYVAFKKGRKTKFE